MEEIIDKDGRRRKAKPGEVLADGEVMVVRMVGRDGKPYEAAFDGNGAHPIAVSLAGHKPGYRAGDTAAQDRSHGAALARRHQLSNAWRAGDAAVVSPEADPRGAYIKRLADAWRTA